MTCQTCGRPAENGQATHWLGCSGIPSQPLTEDEAIAKGLLPPKQDPKEKSELLCGHEGCEELKKEWSGKGAKPKYCAAGHKKEK